MRLGVNLPGPFWASFNIPTGGRRRTGGSGGGCMTALLALFLWPFYLLYLLAIGVGKLYQVAWRKPRTRKGKIFSVSGVSAGLLVLFIIAAAAGGSPAQTTPKVPSAVQVSTARTHSPPTPKATHKAARASASPAQPTHTAAPTPAHSSPATEVPATQAPATQAPATQAPATQAAPAPSCHPLSSSGHCYEPGEFCSDADHGMHGVAGDGKSIACEDDDGWRWVDA